MTTTNNFIKEQLRNNFKDANLTDLDLHEISEWIGFETDIDWKSDIRIFKTFRDYIQYMYFDHNDYQGTSGPAFDLVSNLTQMVTETHLQTLNVHDALILDPDNTLELTSGKYFVVLI